MKKVIVALLVFSASAPVRLAAANEPGGDTGGPSRSASPVIKRFSIQPERISLGDGDNWPITWADDGDQYTVYCDGKGFGGGSGQGSMCQAKIVGDPPHFNGVNLASQSGRRTGGGPTWN